MNDKIDESAGVGSVSKKEAEQAVPASAPQFIVDTFRSVKEPPKIKPSDDAILADGADSEFWGILKRYINAKQAKIKTSVQEKFNSGSLSMEQIGLQSLMRDAVLDNLDDIIKKVEGTQAVIEEQKKRQQQEKADEASRKSKSK